VRGAYSAQGSGVAVGGAGVGVGGAGVGLGTAVGARVAVGGGGAVGGMAVAALVGGAVATDACSAWDELHALINSKKANSAVLRGIVCSL
jgi:hypothetical protein